jgi:hypothetical protein
MPLDETSLSTKPGRVSPWPFIWAIIFVLGLTLWINFVIHGDAARAWRALLVNFIFFTPLAAGMVVWPAVAIISHGQWARSIERPAFAALTFAPLTIIALIALWYSYPLWAVLWIKKSSPLFNTWLNPTFLFGRDIAVLTIVWILAAVFTAKAKNELPKVLGGWLAFSYAIAFTLIGFDLVMSLDPHWFSTLFGWYFVMSAMYAALAAWTFNAVFRRQASIEQQHDLGKLIVALSLVTTYMMYSQLLPIWYEDLPHEIRFVVQRLHVSDWRYVSTALLSTIYLGPLVILLTRWSKRTPAFLACVALLILTGLWVERWWLVTPTLGGKLSFGLTEISITAVFAAAFIMCLNQFGKNAPKAQQEAVNG